MEPLELHYSRRKLVRLGLLSLVGTAAGVWVATGGIAAGEERHGRGAGIGRLLGPEGLQMLGWAVAAVTLLLALLYVRRAFADPVAARADGDRVTLNTLLGSRRYPAAEIDRLELQHPAGQPILQVFPAPGRGRTRGLAVNGLVEDSDEVAAWVEAVEAAHGRRGER